MKHKAIAFSAVINFSIFLIVYFGILFFFENTSRPLLATLAGGCMILLGPKVKSYETQAGKKYQINWIFYKDVIKL